jgi:glutaryl-CoA dehydrogenase
MLPMALSANAMKELRMTRPAEKVAGKRAAELKDAAFNWQDPLDLEGELTEEERIVRDTARGFAQDYLMPRVIEAYRKEQYDPNNVPGCSMHSPAPYVDRRE